MARHMARLAALIVALMVALSPALAVQPDEMLPDPALEARARSLSAELRCLICQSQSIDESDAEIARDLRVLIRERLKAGDSDAEVKDFLVARYGEYVLLKPAFAWHTALLWGAAPPSRSVSRPRRRPASRRSFPARTERRLHYETFIGVTAVRKVAGVTLLLENCGSPPGRGSPER